MNVIRTQIVELTAIPAIAYKQKLASGSSGLKIQRLDSDNTASATLDKRTGDAVPFGNFCANLFPSEAFDEAIELTIGLPYSKRGTVKINIQEADNATETATDVETVEIEKISMIASDEYAAIIARYSDENGKLNYALMNKDFIQFAAKSKVVGDMVGGKNSPEDILVFIVKSRAAFIAGKKDDLNDASAKALIETLDEIDPRSAFKELKLHINKMLARTGK